VKVDAFKGSFSGKVAIIGAGIVASPFPTGDFTKTRQRVPVRMILDKVRTGLIPGLSVEVMIKTRTLFKLPFGLDAGR
jgi:membrane fusion protein (multidrug efflux system)